MKGKAEPLHLWRAVRVVAGAGGRDQEQLVEAPFIGRETELRLIKELFHGTVERGSARLVAITGEAGVGQVARCGGSSPTTSMGWRTRSSGISAGACPTGTGSPTGRWRRWSASASGSRRTRRRAEAAEKLARGTRAVDPGSGGAGVHLARASARCWAWPSRGWTGRSCSPAGGCSSSASPTQEPVVLVFEDMQWADEGLLDVHRAAAGLVRALTDLHPDPGPAGAADAAGGVAGGSRRGATHRSSWEPLDDAVDAGDAVRAGR